VKDSVRIEARLQGKGIPPQHVVHSLSLSLSLSLVSIRDRSRRASCSREIARNDALIG